MDAHAKLLSQTPCCRITTLDMQYSLVVQLSLAASFPHGHAPAFRSLAHIL
jgi:hypothetical protein